MKPVFLLQNNAYDRIGRLIAPCLDYCRENGAEFIDRSLTAEFDPDLLDVDTSSGVLVYGSVGWVRKFKSSARFGSWISYDGDAFATSAWTEHFGDRALNYGGQIETLERVTALLSAGAVLHVRPDRDDKAFNGGVYDRESWSGEVTRRRSEKGADLPSDLRCWVSSPAEIGAEARCWFVGGELVSGSLYRRDGQRLIQRLEEGPLMEAASVFADVHLPCRDIVMDVAETPGGIKLLEFNPIHSSGWYAGDVTRILDAWCRQLVYVASMGDRPCPPLQPGEAP